MAATNPVQRARPDSTGAPIAGAVRSSRTIFERLTSAWQALTADVTPLPDPAGVFAWSMAEIAGANFTRMADDDDGPRVAIHLPLIGNPMWRASAESEAEIERRIRKVWPELEADQVRKLMAHVAARVRAALIQPVRGDDQAEQGKRGAYVNRWRA
ncbi:hypothetical protein QT562_15240 [Xanthomonas citri pv. citri]|uniref:Uncharacterized protein n=1 Tax=Xanthomonas citri pv. citri TaxID=611301 RepID=A0A0U5FBE0_XANCI|nr:MULTISPECIES: hypothetical protein [Xanthomonas]AGH77155.1 hypothetical protein XAC29_08345 [Xanthomonas axonopodis Xac29-1]AJD68253.1 hypothetical protein J151_01811 [Xanthomonas citri subsp. citri A306]AJY90633.1 hypothetical protein J169_01808 [Xanthomonas citri pv. citri]AJZ08374.1 hypothetical protein J172_01802 [Xanthomonas citri pv. citri]AJZ30542.1 hypothetical protein J171_01804 [Xanthomonas citri pv. citri]